MSEDIKSIKRKLKSGEYNGADLMKAWCALENQERRINELESFLSDMLCDYQITASYAEHDGLETEYAKLSAKAKELLK